jgi:hypothetical protein
MASRYLFGPVSREFAQQNLRAAIERGECLAFGDEGDLPVRWGDSWASIAGRFPGGWQPDFVVLFPQYRVVPQGLWDAPCPSSAWPVTGTCCGTGIGSACRAATWC